MRINIYGGFSMNIIKGISAVILAALLATAVMGCGKKNENTADEDGGRAVVDEMVYGSFKSAVSGEGTYEITGYVYDVTKPQEALHDVVVPAEIDGRQVTGIAKDAFKALKVIKSVTIPEGITYIGQYAFFDCDEITSIVIPDSVTSIGIGVFENCDKLESVTLPKGLKTIEKNTFRECTKLGNVALPETLESIGSAAFWNCDSITEVTIPETVKDLGDAAFYECASLVKVTALGEALGKTEVDETLEEDDEDRYTYHPIGEIVFHSCHKDLVVTVTEGTEFAKYAIDSKYKVDVKAVENGQPA